MLSHPQTRNSLRLVGHLGHSSLNAFERIHEGSNERLSAQYSRSNLQPIYQLYYPPPDLSISDQELPTLAACHLPGGDIEAVEEGGCGDHEDQGRESLLVVVPGGLVPDRIRDRVGPVGKAGDGPGEREGGTVGGGEVGGLPP